MLQLSKVEILAMMETAIAPAEAVLSAQRLWDSNGGICQAEIRAESGSKDDI